MNKKHFYIAATIVIIGALIVIFSLLMYPNRSRTSGKFSTSAQQMNTVKPQEIVILKDGDIYNLTASIVKKTINGQEMKMLAYNGSIPGPLIKVSQGAQITLNFKNDTDVDSTVHSHGIRVENKFDGVPDVTQNAVKPGQSFTYELKFPDAGIYWYHPHVREDYAQELGLYGNFLVTPNTSDYWAEVDREETLFLDDILIENGQIATFDKSTVNHTLMGRFGNTMLVNGDDDYRLSIIQGERVRLYITNSANTRTFNFTIPNTQMKLVGSDNGKYEREEWVDSVIIGPSERQIVEIWFDKAGNYEMVNNTPDKSYTLGTIAVSANADITPFVVSPRINNDFIASITALRSLFDKTADKNVTLSMQMGNEKSTTQNDSMGGHKMGTSQMMRNRQMAMGNVQKIEWDDDMGMMNANSTTDTLKWMIIDDETQNANMDINWQFKKGDIVKFKIFNDDQSMHPMQHPVHIHGQRFLVLSTNGQKNQNLVWKDTTLIQTGDTVELLVQMDNPGDWVVHCHIPEHMESGMMSRFKVIDQ